MIHLDTHILVILYQEGARDLPSFARRSLERARLVISPMVQMELQYLFELDRIDGPASTVLDDLAPRLEIVVSTAPFQAVVQAATALTWTRDPFDRLIAAQSVADRADLLTADHTIRANLATAFWDQPTRSAR